MSVELTGTVAEWQVRSAEVTNIVSAPSSLNRRTSTRTMHVLSLSRALSKLIRGWQRMIRIAQASPSPDPPFLRLPRELRDGIYSYTTVTVTLNGFRDLKFPLVTMHCCASPRLLRVNRQIRDEYIEHTQPRQVLSIDARFTEPPQLQDLDIGAIVPLWALGKIRRSALVIHWITAAAFGDVEDWKRFAIAASQGSVSQADMQWTPSKGTSATLITLLVHILGLAADL